MGGDNMAVKYDHAVIYNGVFYPTGMPIETEDKPEEKAVSADDAKPARKPKTRAAGK